MILFRSEREFEHVVVDLDRTGNDGGVFGFCAAEASCCGDVYVRRHENRTRTMNDDTSDILALHEDDDVRGEEMECDNDEQVEKESEKVKYISDPDRSARENERSSEETHAQYRSSCVGCVSGRGVAMKHFRGACAHDETMHTFVRDMVPPQGVNEYPVKTLTS